MSVAARISEVLLGGEDESSVASCICRLCCPVLCVVRHCQVADRCRQDAMCSWNRPDAHPCSCAAATMWWEQLQLLAERLRAIPSAPLTIIFFRNRPMLVCKPADSRACTGRHGMLMGRECS
jgi:hypothetical protein